MSVISFTRYRPSPRYPPVVTPWTEARIEEATDPDGPWSVIETVTLDPVDADPTEPQLRSFSTDAADPDSTWFRVVFLDAADNEEPTGPVALAEVSGYPSLAELLADSSSAELAALTDDQADALRDEAIFAVETRCRQSFTAEGTADDPVTKHAVGQGGGVLYLPARLASLSAVEIAGSALGAGDLSLADDFASLSIAQSSPSTWLERALVDSAASEFPNGSQVAISGVWGWEEVPEAVVTALRFHMEDRAAADAHKLAPTVRAARSLGLGSVNQGNLNLSIDHREAMLSARAARQVAGLVWRATGVAV